MAFVAFYTEGNEWGKKPMTPSYFCLFLNTSPLKGAQTKHGPSFEQTAIPFTQG